VVVQRIVEAQITAEAEVVPNSIRLPPAVVENPVPEIVIEVPPATGPEVGEIPVTVGAGGAAEMLAFHWA
jgi:hypothetical protein